jgi:hypothetical protein
VAEVALHELGGCRRHHTYAGAGIVTRITRGEVATGVASRRISLSSSRIIGAAGAERVSFSFAGPVLVQDYAVTVEVASREPLILSRLGRRTGELAALLTERLREARGRTAAFLGSLLLGLDPMALRAAAGLLRDGVAVPAGPLDGIHPDLTGTLVQLATLSARRDAIAELARRTDLAIGFKQLISVRRPAAGTTPWQDHAAAPHIGGHESPAARSGRGWRACWRPGSRRADSSGSARATARSAPTGRSARSAPG